MAGDSSDRPETAGDDGSGRDGTDTEFVWQEDELEAASREELIAHVSELQGRLETVATDVDELREALYFLLDLQVGRVDPAELFERDVTDGDTDRDRP